MVLVQPLQIGQHGEGQIEVGFRAALLQVLRISPHQLQPHLRIAAAVVPHQLRQEMTARAVKVADLQRQVFCLLRLPNPLLGSFLQVQHPLGVLQKELTRPGEGHAAGGAEKELYPQLPLQGGDLMGNSGLGHVKGLGGLRKIPVGGHR